MVLPHTVKHNQALLYDSHKTEGPVARGAAGVMAYHMSDGNTLAVLFMVPFAYNLYPSGNMWNVKIYSGRKRANYKMYKQMYYGNNPLKGDDGYHVKFLGHGLKVRGYLNSSGMAIVKIRVYRA